MKDEDFDLLDDISRAFLQEPNKRSGYLLWTIVAFFTLMLIWAYFAKLDERTSATGKVIPSSKVQNIQHLEGGILAEIFVREGETVKKKQILIQMDDTRFTASYEENSTKYNALFAELIRLRAESEGKEEVVFPKELEQQHADFGQNEKALFIANRENYFANLKSLEENFDNAREQYEIAQPLFHEGIISKLDLLKLEKEMIEAKNQIEIEIKSYQSKVSEQIVNVKSEMDALKKVLAGLEDRMKRTTIRSPVYGIVKKINYHTIGEVIKPGETIMQIVPLDDILLIEAKILPDKIAFIHAGQEADVKITAYDPSKYGSIKGIVKYVSPDAIVKETDLGKEESYYVVLIEIDKNYLEFNDKKLPIIPGMQITADILTGEKTVLEYLLKPLIKTKQKAFRER